MQDRFEGHLWNRLVLVTVLAWLALFSWNPLAWAIVTVATFVVVVGFYISRSIFDIRGPIKIAVSTVACGTGIATVVAFIFYWVSKV